MISRSENHIEIANWLRCAPSDEPRKAFGHLLDEMDEWIGRAGEAERMVESARRSLASVADHMTDHAYQELASALESPPRIAGKTAGFDQPGREQTVGDALGLRRDR